MAQAEQHVLELTAAGDAALDDPHTVERIHSLGQSLGADCVRDGNWNTGSFRAVATAGRLRTAVNKPHLSLGDLSFGLFSTPGDVVVHNVRIYKGHHAGSADAYAVRTRIKFVPPQARGGSVEGVNTVMGVFRLLPGTTDTVDGGAPAMEVVFDRVALEMWSSGDDCGGGELDPCLRPQHIMRLPAPVATTLRVLLQTPNVTVTSSSLGSTAVLVRCDDTWR